MDIALRSITGIEDAITTMFISKNSLTPEMEEDIIKTVQTVTDRNGAMKPENELSVLPQNITGKYNDWMQMLTKWGKIHITMLRFVQISCMVHGLHRAAQDDFDAHAMRLNNRIIRSSSRFAGIKDESHLQNLSEYYADKVMTTDAALKLLDKELPKEIKHDGKTYVRAFNGYIIKGMEDNQDIKRGLYNLGFPSNFIFQCNLTEFAHIYKERNEKGHANPELKKCVETITDEIIRMQPMFDRELLLAIKN